MMRDSNLSPPFRGREFSLASFSLVLKKEIQAQLTGGFGPSGEVGALDGDAQQSMGA